MEKDTCNVRVHWMTGLTEDYNNIFCDSFYVGSSGVIQFRNEDGETYYINSINVKLFIRG